MKIVANPPLSEKELEERRFQRRLKIWRDLGIIQDEGQPWRDIKYITIFETLRLKIYPISERSYYGPSLKKQIQVFEQIKKCWNEDHQPQCTIYVTWEAEFYHKFNIK